MKIASAVSAVLASLAPSVFAQEYQRDIGAGIPAVDLIDFRFGSERANYGPGGPDNAYWHTTADTLDKVSAESLKVVGDTVVVALPRIIAALKR